MSTIERPQVGGGKLLLLVTLRLDFDRDQLPFRTTIDPPDCSGTWRDVSNLRERLVSEERLSKPHAFAFLDGHRWPQSHVVGRHKSDRLDGLPRGDLLRGSPRDGNRETFFDPYHLKLRSAERDTGGTATVSRYRCRPRWHYSWREHIAIPQNAETKGPNAEGARDLRFSGLGILHSTPRDVRGVGTQTVDWRCRGLSDGYAGPTNPLFSAPPCTITRLTESANDQRGFQPLASLAPIQQVDCAVADTEGGLPERFGK